MIRTATAADIPDLVGMARRFHAESRYAADGIAFDRASMRHTLASLIASPQGVVLISGREGFAAGVVFPLYFNASQIAGQELLLWVAPERRTGLGKRLFRALERAFEKAGATLLMMTATATCRPETVGTLYRRAGYRLADLTYTKVL